MGKFIERHNLPKLIQKERENMKRFMSVKCPFWLKNLPWLPGVTYLPTKIKKIDHLSVDKDVKELVLSYTACQNV